MESLSGPVSSLKIRPKSQEYHLKNHLLLLQQQQQSHFILSSATTTSSRPNNKLSNKVTTCSSSTVFATPPFVNSSSSSSSSSGAPSPLKKKSPHRNASTGYAVALLDAARRRNVVEAVQRDAKRLSKWLSQRKGDVEEEILVREIMDKGKFQKLLRKLVILLVDGNKVGMVKQVLMEFARIYGELISTDNDQLVLLQSGLKMEANQVAEIAQRVHTITGAAKVKLRQQLHSSSTIIKPFSQYIAIM